MNKTPEALRLAEWIEGDMTCHGDAEIAEELRRLHAVNVDLLVALHRISLASVNSGCSRYGMGKYARAAIAKAEGGTNEL